MKIRLVDIDGKMPNLALMKISTFYKQFGHDVAWHNPLFDNSVGFDKLYISKLFNFSPNYQYVPADVEVFKGGTGYDLTTKLPEEIEQINKPDYLLYPQHDYSIQFFSRGCIRKCPFCVVPQKEGNIKSVDPMELNPKGKHIEVLDNNFFANPEWKIAINQLLEWKQPVNFSGIDVRIMDEEQAFQLNKIKLFKQLSIAWDNPKQNILPQLKEMLKYIKPYKIQCYVLIGYWSTPEQDLYRVEKLRELKIDPFVMPFDKSNSYQKDFARWVNHKAVFKSVKWQDYKKAS